MCGVASASKNINDIQPPEEELEAIASGGDIQVISDGRNIRVIDGDTVEYSNVKYRLYGIDAPEMDQKQGKISKEALELMLIIGQVKIVTTNTDKYGRKVVKLFVYPSDTYSYYRDSPPFYVNARMVSYGHAWWYEKYAPTDTKLKVAHNTAKHYPRGLWADYSSMHIAPWEWRKLNKAEKSISREPYSWTSSGLCKNSYSSSSEYRIIWAFTEIFRTNSDIDRDNLLDYKIITNPELELVKYRPLVEEHDDVMKLGESLIKDMRKYEIMGDVESSNIAQEMLDNLQKRRRDIMYAIVTYDSKYHHLINTEINLTKGITFKINNTSTLSPNKNCDIDYVYDSKTKKGRISLRIKSEIFTERIKLIKKIGEFSSSKNVRHVAGEENLRTGGCYEILDEKLEDGILTIFFRADY